MKIFPPKSEDNLRFLPFLDETRPKVYLIDTRGRKSTTNYPIIRESSASRDDRSSINSKFSFALSWVGAGGWLPSSSPRSAPFVRAASHAISLKKLIPKMNER